MFFFRRFFFFVILLVFVAVTAQPVRAAKFSLNPSSQHFFQECEYSINVVIDTEGRDTNAADLVLLFDPEKLEIVDQDPVAPGVQMKTGVVYQIYAGNEVNSRNKILLSAFNISGTYNGSSVYGTLFFKPKSGVTSFDLTIDYSPGATVDSNIADQVSQDILDGVTNGSYTVGIGDCTPDSVPPKLINLSPKNAAKNIALDTNVSFSLIDNQSGVDLRTLKMQVDTSIYNASSEEVHITGNALNYAIVINPIKDFPSNKRIDGVVSVSDLDGNTMSPFIFFINQPDDMPIAAICSSSDDKSVVSVPLSSNGIHAQCDDGQDNDDDGLIDYPEDPGCDDAFDNDEKDLPFSSETSVDTECGNLVVENGEQCEPPGTSACNEECQISVYPALFEVPEKSEERAPTVFETVLAPVEKSLWMILAILGVLSVSAGLLAWYIRIRRD